MKTFVYEKSISMIIVLISVLFLIGCEKSVEENIVASTLIETNVTEGKIDTEEIYENAKDRIERQKYFVVCQENEFHAQVFANPIDKKTGMFDPMELNMSSIGIFENWCNYWEQEIDYSLEILCDLLSAEDYQTLRKSQQNWEEYLMQQFEIEQSLYYDTESQYNHVMTGSSVAPLVMRVKAERTRARAIELWGLVYTLSEEKLEFCYKHKFD